MLWENVRSEILCKFYGQQARKQTKRETVNTHTAWETSKTNQNGTPMLRENVRGETLC